MLYFNITYTLLNVLILKPALSDRSELLRRVLGKLLIRKAFPCPCKPKSVSSYNNLRLSPVTDAICHISLHNNFAYFIHKALKECNLVAFGHIAQPCCFISSATVLLTFVLESKSSIELKGAISLCNNRSAEIPNRKRT